MSQTYVPLVQISIFSCGGIASGLTVSHKIVDGFSMSTFMNAWAATAWESSEQINPNFALDVLKTKATTSSLKPSSVTAVMGLLWKSAIVASQMKLSLLIPVWPAYAQQGTDSSPEQQLLVNCIRNAITTIYSNFVEGMKGEDSSAEDFIISSLCKTGFREVDFGWGKPIWSFVGRENRNIYGSRVERIAWLMDTKSGDGIEAWVTLKEDGIAIFDKIQSSRLLLH
ncbi:stemmadenine O-acetyltransferase-like [Coffea arabica]|uniref:Stemmadenine O-acetyltransferase-like n=1 Tax=Coffea arabica TaxID=13443 RepID=A0ABM4U0Y8_COFAR